MENKRIKQDACTVSQYKSNIPPERDLTVTGQRAKYRLRRRFENYFGFRPLVPYYTPFLTCLLTTLC